MTYRIFLAYGPHLSRQSSEGCVAVLAVRISRALARKFLEVRSSAHCVYARLGVMLALVATTVYISNSRLNYLKQ